MAHTNRGRVIWGGLLAGVIINLVEFVTNGVVLKDTWAQVMQGLGKSPQLPASSIVLFNIGGFLAGIAAVWLYAAIRTRYGAGPGTAIRAAFVAWGLTSFLPSLGNYAVGMIPTRVLVITAIVSLVDIVIGTLAGAWVYKEEAVPMSRTAAA